MLFKKYSKLIVGFIIFVVALSVCSCAAVQSIPRDVQRISELKNDIIEISELKDQEEIMAKLETLIHPESGFTKETILEKAKTSPALEGVDIEAEYQKGYKIGDFSDYNLKFNDPTLGGNVYELSIQVTFGDVVFNLHLEILSDETDIGLYDFEITR